MFCLKKFRIIVLLVLLCLVTQAQMCKKSEQRKLLAAEDDAAVAVSKLEQVRTDLLKAGKITQHQATAIDRKLLRINTSIKHVSKASDAFAANPALGSSEARAALAEVRAALDETEAAINDGSLGVVNPDSQKAFVALIQNLKAVATTVEGVISGLEKK